MKPPLGTYHRGPCRSWRGKILWGVLLALSVGFLTPEHCPSAENLQQQKKRVLILYSFENEVGLFSDFDESLRTTLKAGRIGRIKFYTEFLDLVRFGGPQHEKELQTYLRTKYSNEKIDLIIPVSLPAIDFIVKYDEELFPGIPVVFCTFGRHWVVRGPLPQNVTGVVETTTIDRTIAAAVQLQPYTRSVAIVGGTLPYERDWMKEIRDHLREHEGKLEFAYLTDLSMGVLLQRVANLPPHTIVLYMMMWRDGAGEYFLPKEALARIAQAANAPVYGVFESFMGSGLMGGDLVPFKTAGKTTAEVGLRVLRGENPADIPVLSENNASYIFDWRQLQRWNISEGRLPAGSLVLFKERSFWDRYKRPVIEVLVLIAAETIVILLLLVQRRKRKRAEASLRESEARYLAFVANSFEGIARFEPDQPMPVTLPKSEQVHYLLEHSYLAECNDAFARMYHVEMSRDFMGARLADLLLPSEPQSLGFLEAFVRSGYDLQDHLTKERDPQGHLRWLENRATGILEDGCLARTWIVQRDVTDRKRVERDLRKLGVRMLMVQEEERRRMARELHDDFSQRLALLAIDLEQLAQRPPATKHDWDTRIRAMWSQTQELTSDIHRLSHQLHPSRLEDLGLVMAVRSYCHEISKQGNLAVDFSDDNVPLLLPKEVALCVYRIVQEALRNVIKHSGSRTAVVELKGGPEEIRLEVSDSGKGFDPEAATAGEGLGLASMRERVRNLGGELSITSGPAQGTRVAVRIPFAPIES